MSLGRHQINAIHRALAPGSEVHPGLRLAHGLSEWPNAAEAHSKHDLIRSVARIKTPDFYRQALQRWKNLTGDRQRFCGFELALHQRLYIGVTRDNPVETGVTVSHSYGMPIIPGSTVKGLARASAEYIERQTGEIRRDVIAWLFGEGGDDGESGGIYYHDAWWCGNSDTPFVPEIVTPHHTEYYQNGRKAASDMDSPIPAPQIAVQGSFYFVIEGAPEWTAVAAALLRAGLPQWGVGGKKSSGYGRFRLEP